MPTVVVVTTMLLATAAPASLPLATADAAIHARGGPKPPPPPPAPFDGSLHFHLGFNVNRSGLYGCCADVNFIGEYEGVKHIFRQSGNPKGDLGWEHHVSEDWVRWRQLPTILQPGAADGSLSLLDEGPVIMWDCNSAADCRPRQSHRQRRGSLLDVGHCVGDASIIGIARPVDAGDPNLTTWRKDAHVAVAGASCYSGPSNAWQTADGAVHFEMINNASEYGAQTSLFINTTADLAAWKVETDIFYPQRGGGGGLFFRLPGDPAAPYTHMLQSDFPGRGDGSTFFALGTYDSSAGTFTNTSGPRSLDFGLQLSELGYRADGTMVSAGWIGQLGASVVREVTYDPQLTTLILNPVPELESLRGALLGSHGATNLRANSSVVLVSDNSTATSFDLEMFFDLPPGGVGVDITVLGNVHIVVVVEAQVVGAPSLSRNATLFLGNAHSNCSGVMALPKQLEMLSLRVLVDVVGVEAFAAGGRGAASKSFPAQPGAGGVVVSSVGSATMRNASVWRMTESV